MRAEVARRVASALGIELDAADRSVAADPSAALDPDAYITYIQARHLVHTLDPRATTAAIEMLQGVLERCPNFVPVHLELARAELNLTYGSRTLADWQRVEDMVLRAEAIDPNSAGVYAFLGWIASQRDNDWPRARRYFLRALDLEPGNIDTLRPMVPVLLDLYQLDRAVVVGQYVTARDPLCAACLRHLATAQSLAGQYDQAAATIERALAIAPDQPSSLGVAAEIDMLSGRLTAALARVDRFPPDDFSRLWVESLALLRLGDSEAAERAFSRLRERWGEVEPSAVAHIYARTGRIDDAFEWLARVEFETGPRPASYHDARWPELVADPRWRAFQERIGVAPEQRAVYQMDIRLPS
jgi:tetratricopeptide (TPR) repeat protein